MRLNQLKRLSHLIRHEIRDEEFDMAVWLNKKPKGRHCGTTGCAIGHGISRFKDWQDEGFVLQAYDNGQAVPVFGEHENFCAIAEFFGIRIMDALKLFNPFFGDCSKGTRDEFSDYLDRFILDHQSQRPTTHKE